MGEVYSAFPISRHFGQIGAISFSYDSIQLLAAWGPGLGEFGLFVRIGPHKFRGRAIHSESGLGYYILSEFLMCLINVYSNYCYYCTKGGC